MMNDSEKVLCKAWFLDRKTDLLAIGLLAILAAWLFRKHLGGELTFLGNPDRLDNNLKILKHYVDTLASGGLSAWNGTELLGYDTFSLPYTFPNPLTFLTYWFGAGNIYITAGFISAGLLGLAGISAYLALRHFVDNKFASLTGAILYQFSTLSVLKVSQNDMSFAVFIFIPLLVLMVRRIQGHNLASSYLALSFLITLLLHFTFLQKAAYALLLTGSYALYRTWNTRDWRPITVLAGAVVTSTVAAFPRLWSLVIAMSQYTRGETHGPQGILPFEILRWFDNTIFGKHFADPVTITNGLNLSEGFLLYTSGLTPVLIMLGVIWYRKGWFRLATDRDNDTSFFPWFLLFTFSLFLFKPALLFVYYLFLKVDFIHARILIAGLFPIVIIISLILTDLAPPPLEREKPSELLLIALFGALLAILILSGIEAAADLTNGGWHVSAASKLYLDRTAVTRTVLSAMVAIGLVLPLKFGILSPLKAPVVFVTLCLTAAGQTLLAANFQLNGEHTRTAALPFKNGGFYSTDRSAFHVPTPESIEKLHETLQRDAYRSVIICDRRIAGGFCAAHIGEFWRLRLADGYYGVGLPKRIASLPWETSRGQREVLFTSEKNLPWKLLGFLNVKYAVIADDRLYRNIPGPADDDGSNDSRRRPEIIENPANVVPRAFFAKRVLPTGSADDAIKNIFSGAAFNDVTRTSFAEGFDTEGNFEAAGKLLAAGGNDEVELTLDRSDKPRFLVLNELFYPGWTAQIDGLETKIYPTNAVMRGVIVPAGATAVTFRYRPFVKSNAAKALYISGLLLLVIGVFGFRRLSRKQ